MKHRPKKKRCTRCGARRTRAQFGRDARLKDGLKSWCRACEREWQREYYRRSVGARPKG